MDAESASPWMISCCGIFTSVSGAVGSRVFNIEWRAVYFGSGAAVNYEVRLLENTQTFEVIYATVPEGGLNATVGVQRDGTTFTQFECNTGGLSAGQKLTFAYVQGNCPSPTPTNTATATATATATNTPICPGDWTAQAVYPLSIYDAGATGQGRPDRHRHR